MHNKKEFEKWALKELLKLQKILLLDDHYPVEIEYGTAQANSYADCKFTYPYKSVTIGYSDQMLKDFKGKKYLQIKNSLAHEMCHVFTDPLYAKACNRFVSRNEIEDEREQLVEHIANIVLKHKLY